MSLIRGVGIDMVSMARIDRVFRRYSTRFPRKLLHPGEYDDYHRSRHPSRFLARRFAAKEAVVKALGLGFTNGAYANRIQINHDDSGEPRVTLPRELPARYREYEALLSISDEKHYAVAQAIVLIRER